MKRVPIRDSSVFFWEVRREFQGTKVVVALFVRGGMRGGNRATRGPRRVLFPKATRVGSNTSTRGPSITASVRVGRRIRPNGGAAARANPRWVGQKSVNSESE